MRDGIQIRCYVVLLLTVQQVVKGVTSSLLHWQAALWRPTKPHGKLFRQVGCGGVIIDIIGACSKAIKLNTQHTLVKGLNAQDARHTLLLTKHTRRALYVQATLQFGQQGSPTRFHPPQSCAISTNRTVPSAGFRQLPKNMIARSLLPAAGWLYWGCTLNFTGRVMLVMDCRMPVASNVPASSRQQVR